MKHFVILICIFFLISTLTAQPGKLDKNFGMNGLVVSGNNYDYCHSVALQPDGKIIQAGEGSCSSKYGFLLRRFNTDGSADESFGKNGCVVTEVSEYSAIYAVAVQSDGRIIAGGIIITPANDVETVIARYNIDGKPDSSFGENGFVIEERATDDYLTAIGIQDDGKIIAVGNTTSTEGFVYRYLSDGTPDESFGESGKVFTVFERSKQINSLLVKADGKIVIGALYDRYSQTPDFMLAQYLPDGGIDLEFGSNGLAISGFTDGFRAVNLYAIAQQHDGQIVAVGTAGMGNDNSMALMRFYENGILDQTFGNEGWVITDFGQYLSEAKSVLIQTDGKIITAGRYYDGSTFSYFAMARHHNNGNIDSSFAKEGLQVTNAGGNGGSDAAVLQPDGKIILAGDIYISGSPSKILFTLLRYNGGDEVLASGLEQFTAAQHTEGIILNWQTRQETNNDYFTAERSATADATSYTTIARIESHGNSSAVQHYSFTDQFPLAGDNYYRLKQTNADGNYSYSATVYIRYTGKSGITIFPNPATDLLTIQGLKASGKNTVSIYDLHGRLLQRFIVQSVSSHSFSVHQLSTGTYIISVQTGSSTERLKFVKK